MARAGSDVRGDTARPCPILGDTGQRHEARSRRRASRARWARLAEQTQLHGPPPRAAVCRCLASETAASKAQDPSQHLAAPGTATGCAKRGVACLVSHWQKLWAPEEPEEGNLHVRICGEGTGEPVPLPGSRLPTAYAPLRLPAAADAQRSAAYRSLGQVAYEVYQTVYSPLQ